MDNTRLEELFREILAELEPDTHERGGLEDTPKRMARAMREYTSGYGKDPSEVLKTFEDGSQGYDSIVVVRDIPVYSMCEHHLAPFFGTATIAYLPQSSIVGLSKFARLVDMFARRLQVQERLTVQVADEIEFNLMPRGVFVMMRCRHMCMEARGVKVHNVETITSAVRGFFKENSAARAEVLSLVNG